LAKPWTSSRAKARASATKLPRRSRTVPTPWNAPRRPPSRSRLGQWTRAVSP
jgi:hypothetical protein